jgi:hypothetical protein
MSKILEHSRAFTRAFVKSFAKSLRVSEFAALTSSGVLIATGAATVAGGAPVMVGILCGAIGLLTLGFVVNANYERGVKDGYICCLHTICNGQDIEVRHVHETKEPGS